MKFDFENKVYIGCIPLWAHPEHPTDQSACTIEVCPTCKNQMWVSERKRARKATHPNVEIHCLRCIVESAHEQGHDLEVQDISNMN